VPKLHRIRLGQVGTQEVPALASAHFPEFFSIESIAEGAALIGHAYLDESPGGGDFATRAAELHQQLIAREPHPLKLCARAHSHSSAASASSARGVRHFEIAKNVPENLESGMVLNRVGSPLRDNPSRHRNDPDGRPLLAGEIQSEATAKAVEHPPEPKVGAPVPDPTDSSDPPCDYTGRVMD
jgi:hypothetical protein